MIHKLDLSSLFVVIIDDDEDILEGMEKMLNNWGCNTVAGLSRSDVQRQLDGTNSVPDIIISDFRLCHNQNGIDAIEDIREEYNVRIPAILITGDTNPEQVSKGT